MTDWTKGDAVELRDYLKKESGKKLLKLIDEFRPSVTGSTAEIVFGQAYHQKGWEDLKACIIASSEFEGTDEQPDPFIKVDKD